MRSASQARAMASDIDTVMLGSHEQQRLSRIANSIEQLGILIENAGPGIVNTAHIGQLLSVLGEGLHAVADNAVPMPQLN